MALRRDCSFPFCVIGPVLLAALRRFAETCFSEAMLYNLRINWLRSVICSRPDAEPPGVVPLVLAVEVIEPRSEMSSSGLYGAFIVKAASRHFLSSFVIPFFCSTGAASILPSRPHISIAVARSGGQGRRFFSAAEGLVLDGREHGGRLPAIGGWPHDDPRGACHWSRSIARTTLVFG